MSHLAVLVISDHSEDIIDTKCQIFKGNSRCSCSRIDINIFRSSEDEGILGSRIIIYICIIPVVGTVAGDEHISICDDISIGGQRNDGRGLA